MTSQSNTGLHHIPSLFFKGLACNQNNPLFADYYKEQWHWLSWLDIAKQMSAYSKHLRDVGIAPGDKVALMGANSSAWVCADLAIQSIGAVTLPLYPSNTSEQTKYIIEHSEAKLLLIGESCWDHAFVKDTQMSSNLMLMAFHIAKKNTQPNSPFANLNSELEDIKSIERLQIGLSNIQDHDLSSLIYTSGTTGQAKGVMLSHSNIYHNVINSSKDIPIKEEDVAISFLPLCHAFERTAALYTYLYYGCQVAFVDDFDKVKQSLADIKPSLFCSVPRVLEKIYIGIKQKLRKIPFGIGKNLLDKLNNEYCSLNFIEKALVNRVKKKLTQQLGSRLKFIVCGGASIDKDILCFFMHFNILILQGYGLTESSPVIAANTPLHNRYGSVGKALFGTDCKIGAQNELLVKSKSIMTGYFKDHSTDHLDNDGYLKTGDIAHIDDDGYIFITDRLKDLFVSASGKNIAPSPIENKLTQSTMIEQACLLGDKRPYITALIVPKPSLLEQWRHLQQNKQSTSELEQDMHKKIQYVIDRVNQNLARHEQIKRFSICNALFSIENKCLTPTLKLKRRNIEQKYHHNIKTLYS